MRGGDKRQQKARAESLNEMRVFFVEMTIFRIRAYLCIPLFPIFGKEEEVPNASPLCPLPNASISSDVSGQIAMARWFSHVLKKPSQNGAKKSSLRKYVYSCSTSSGTNADDMPLLSGVRVAS